MCLYINKYCCFDLKTGCMIIGILDTLLMLISFMNPSGEASYGPMDIVDLVLSVSAGVFLMLAVTNGKPGYLLFWMVLKGIAIVFYCIMVIWLIIEESVVAAASREKEDAGKKEKVAGILEDSVFPIFLEAVNIVMNIYWWAVVRSYRAEITKSLPI